MRYQDIFVELKATQGKKAKEQLVIDNKDHLHSAFAHVKVAFNPFETFGVSEKMVPKTANEYSLPIGCEHPQSDLTFEDLMGKLQSRELSGNAAIEELQAFANTVGNNDWVRYYRRILTCKLDCGFSEKHINKFCKEHADLEQFSWETFNCQLAVDGKDIKHEGKRFIDYKLDGARCIGIINTETRNVQLVTREGRPMDKFPHIKALFEDVAKVLPWRNSDFKNKTIMIDGEVTATNFQALMKQVLKKGDPVLTGDVAIFNAFDLVIMGDEFKDANLAQRQGYLGIFDVCVRDVMDKENFETIHPDAGFIPGDYPDCFLSLHMEPYGKWVDFDTEKGQKEFKEFNRVAIEKGYEGIMVKQNTPYTFKRSKDWMKIKPVVEVTLEIAEVVEGTGKYEGTMGAIRVEGTLEDHDEGFPSDVFLSRVPVSVSVGTGFSDELRDEIWADRANMIGRKVEIKCDMVSLADGVDVYSLRFPRFKGFRGTNSGEKI